MILLRLVFEVVASLEEPFLATALANQPESYSPLILLHLVGNSQLTAAIALRFGC